MYQESGFTLPDGRVVLVEDLFAFKVGDADVTFFAATQGPCTFRRESGAAMFPCLAKATVGVPLGGKVGVVLVHFLLCVLNV